MSIDLIKSNYFVGIWFVGHDPDLPVEDRMDWLCGAWREEGADHYTVRYRFRYHQSESPFATGDEKNWYGFSIGVNDRVDAEAHVSKVCSDAAVAVAMRNRTDVHFLNIKGDGDKAAEMLQAMPWAHMQKAEDRDEHSTDDL